MLTTRWWSGGGGVQVEAGRTEDAWSRECCGCREDEKMRPAPICCPGCAAEPGPNQQACDSLLRRLVSVLTRKRRVPND
jgi:hypothetical protein